MIVDDDASVMEFLIAAIDDFGEVQAPEQRSHPIRFPGALERDLPDELQRRRRIGADVPQQPGQARGRKHMIRLRFERPAVSLDGFGEQSELFAAEGAGDDLVGIR